MRKNIAHGKMLNKKTTKNITKNKQQKMKHQISNLQIIAHRSSEHNRGQEI